MPIYNVAPSFTAPNGTVSRPLQDRFADRLNVKDFGATGNGTSDDRVALQAAIVKGQATGLPVWLPAGTYMISDQLGGAMTGHLDLVLDKRATIKAAVGFPAASKKLLFLTNTTLGAGLQVSIAGGCFDSRNQPNSDTGQANDTVYIAGKGIDEVIISGTRFYSGDDFATAGSDSLLFCSEMSNLTIEKCRFIGAKDVAIYISGDSTETYGSDAIIEKCRFDNCSSAIISKRSFKRYIASQNVIRNCQFGILQGVADTTKKPGKDNIITHNHIIGAQRAIEAAISDTTIITNNRIESIGYGNAPTDGTGIQLSGSSYCMVMGNIITGINPTATISGNFRAIYVITRDVDGVTYNSQRNAISNNVIVGVGETYRESGSTCDYNSVKLEQAVNCQSWEPKLSGNHSFYNFFGPTGEGIDNLEGTYRKGTTMRWVRRVNGNSGFGTTNPQAPLHLQNGSVSATGPTGTQLLVESSTDAVAALAAGATGKCRLTFGGAGSTVAAELVYNAALGQVQVVVAGNVVAAWNSSGPV